MIGHVNEETVCCLWGRNQISE